MKKIEKPVRIALLAGIFIAIGFFGKSLLPKTETRISFYPYVSTEKNKTEFSCDSVASASISKDLLEDKVAVSSGKGTDKVSIKIEPDGKFVTLLTRAGMEVGATEGEKFLIVEQDDQMVVAIANLGSLGPNYSTLVLSKKDSQGLWTKASDNLLRYGEVMYLNCR